MDPQPDVLTLKRIYEAERQADRIVREAEEEAEVLLRSADAEAAGVLDAMRRRLPLRREEALNEAISSIEAEAGALLENAKARTDRWSRERNADIGRIADGLLERLLPS
jgi:vacuolar-type H+-ATPase subunit H